MIQIQPLYFVDNKVLIIDQTLLPAQNLQIEIDTIEKMWEAIKKLRIRGAPAIGIAAAYGLWLGMKTETFSNNDAWKQRFQYCCDYLKTSRPTAVNLFWAIDRVAALVQKIEDQPVDQVIHAILDEAHLIHQQDIETCRKIGEFGAKLITENDVVLTHCNAGALATGAYGTALSAFYCAHEQGKKFSVFADETRPLLQGARLTAWELQQAGVDVTLISDNMAAHTIRAKKITKIIIGADRIAANGDAANKIGSYGLGVLAKYHNIPLYIAAPLSTFDFNTPSGKEIPIEERDAEELRFFCGAQSAPLQIQTYNPAFDVVDASLIKAFITPFGLFKPEEIAKLQSF